jgi:phage-related protein
VTADELTQLIWVGPSLDDMRGFPEEVRQVMGFALYLAQVGDKHVAAKPLRGFGGAAVLEVVDEHGGAAYRCIYTVRFPDAVYVLHAFKKKAKHGVATPKRTMHLVRTRLERAQRIHESQHASKGGGPK